VVPAQAQGGKAGVLGPTKIYLAVQPPKPAAGATPGAAPGAAAPSPATPALAATPQSPRKVLTKVVTQEGQVSRQYRKEP